MNIYTHETKTSTVLSVLQKSANSLSCPYMYLRPPTSKDELYFPSSGSGCDFVWSVELGRSQAVIVPDPALKDPASVTVMPEENSPDIW